MIVNINGTEINLNQKHVCLLMTTIKDVLNNCIENIQKNPVEYAEEILAADSILTSLGAVYSEELRKALRFSETIEVASENSGELIEPITKSKLMEELSIDLDEYEVLLDEDIVELGLYNVTIKWRNCCDNLKVWVVPK